MSRRISSSTRVNTAETASDPRHPSRLEKNTNTWLSYPIVVRPFGAVEGTRIDQWLWAIRIYRTRSAAADGCRGGHVKINDAAAKPASPVKVGDRVSARVHDRQRELEVVQLISKRVGAALAVECYVDHSPPAPPNEYLPRLFPRLAGAGRPTKRD